MRLSRNLAAHGDLLDKFVEHRYNRTKDAMRSSKIV
jgi:hypothetical protein